MNIYIAIIQWIKYLSIRKSLIQPVDAASIGNEIVDIQDLGHATHVLDIDVFYYTYFIS